MTEGQSRRPISYQDFWGKRTKSENHQEEDNFLEPQDVSVRFVRTRAQHSEQQTPHPGMSR